MASGLRIFWIIYLSLTSVQGWSQTATEISASAHWLMTYVEEADPMQVHAFTDPQAAQLFLHVSGGQPQAHHAALSLYNAQGQRCGYWELDWSSPRLLSFSEISRLPSGLYWIRLYVEDGFYWAQTLLL